jgi:hypothetical protein
MYVDPIVIHRGRTERVAVKLSYSVSSDVITSQIRIAMNPTSTFIANFVVSVSSDGRTIYLDLDDFETQNITQSGGYMDIKRVTGGEPVNVLQHPIPVIFVDSVTE